MYHSSCAHTYLSCLFLSSNELLPVMLFLSSYLLSPLSHSLAVSLLTASGRRREDGSDNDSVGSADFSDDELASPSSAAGAKAGAGAGEEEVEEKSQEDTYDELVEQLSEKR